MSYAIHDNQPSQRWNGAMYTPNKRKTTLATYESDSEARPNKKSQFDKETSDDDEDNVKPVPKRNDCAFKRRGESPHSSSVQFLIDGTAPRRPSPQLLEKRTETRHGSGRQRSVYLKGLIMGLIDETYPPFVCPTCYFTASARSLIDAHFKNTHRGVKAFKCVDAKCDQAYSSRPGLRYHLEHAHSVTLSVESHSQINQPSKPSKASKPAPSKKISTTRQRSNNKTTTVESNSKRLKKHELSSQLQSKLDETYNITVCPSCKVQFKRKTHVIRHLVEAHHGEEPYKCVVSNCKRTKTYATREGLVYHLASYHDDEMQN